MPLPEINYCIVCEGLRAEERHKSTILGFFNILPWVEIKLPELGSPVGNLMFVFGTSGGSGKGNFQVTIFNPDGSELIKTPEIPVPFKEGFDKANIGIGLDNLIFKMTGTHIVKVRVSGQPKFEESFKVTLDPSVNGP